MCPFSRLAHCSAGLPESNDLVWGNSSQLGWLHSYRSDCASATGTNTSGCWCQQSDWDNPTGDGYVYRLTSFLPIEWFGPKASSQIPALGSNGYWLDPTCSAPWQNTGDCTPNANGLAPGPSIPRRQPPDRYTHPNAWVEGNSSSQKSYTNFMTAFDYVGVYDSTTGVYDCDPHHYIASGDRVQASYTDDYGYTNEGRQWLVTDVSNVPVPCEPGSSVATVDAPWRNTLMSM